MNCGKGPWVALEIGPESFSNQVSQGMMLVSNATLLSSPVIATQLSIKALEEVAIEWQVICRGSCFV